jgi:hypothetical protein
MGMMVRGVLVAVILSVWLAGSAQAETYRWTDDGGVVHFADDSDKIPSRYRQKATIERDMSSVNIMPANGPAAAPESGAETKSGTAHSKQNTATKKLKKSNKISSAKYVKKGHRKPNLVVKTSPVAVSPARQAQNQAEEQIRKDRQAIDDAQMPARRAQDQAEEQIRKSREH